MLPVDFHTVEGSNDVKAVYKAMHVEMSGVTLIQENDYYNDDAGMWETVKGEVFKGQWLVCDFGHEFSTELRIVARTGIKRLFPGLWSKQTMRNLIKNLSSSRKMNRKSAIS